MSISEEHIQQITRWNQTATDFPRTQTVHGLFEAQVAATPDAIALEFDKQLLSYRELNQRANCLAHYLVKRGVGREVRVGLMMERSLDMVVALLGILKAGGAYVPLDLDYPLSRIAFMLQDANAPVLLSQSSLSAQLPEFAGERIFLDRDWAQIEQESAENPGTDGTAENLAYVIYTSGSTGTPKGVEIQHRAINRLVCNTDYYQVGPSDRIIHSASVSFDAATFELWGALLNGARLVGIDKNRFLSSQSLAAFLQARAITAMFVTTAVFNQIARELPGAFSGLKCLMFGGEAVDCAAVRRVLAHHPPERLLHVYGPTESTTFASWYPVDSVADDATTVPIGWPLANTTLQVLDQQMNPVAIGEPGELYIGGEGLARGYLNQPRLTAERFVANPFVDDPASRLYRTGDKVRYREDGAIEFIGRFDDQVKLRGFRIELGEVEAAIRSHSGVSDAVVSLMPGRSGDKQLVAHVVGESNGSGCEISELRDYLQQKLPSFMLPAFFVALDVLPLTPNGKVDKQSLPQPDSGRPQLSSDYIAPRNELEQKLVAIWEEVLGLEQIGVEDLFPELGGQSLLATRIITRIREMLGVEFSLADFYRDLNVAGMALRLEHAGPAVESKAIPVIGTAPRVDPIPVTFSQERTVFLNQLTPESLAYNTQMGIRFNGQLDVPALERSLNEIVRRHEIFRTSFDIVDGRPQQRIHPDYEVQLSLTDLSDLPDNQRNERRDEIIDEVVIGHFNIAEIPLVRWKLVKLAVDEHLLLHVEHHLIHDGWSFGVFTHELQALYGAYSRGCESTLPELTVQFADYAIWQRQWMQGETLQVLLDFWTEKLAGPLPALQLPMDFQRPPVQSHRGAEEVIHIDSEIADQLRGLVRRENSSLYVTALTIFLVLLHKYSQQEDIVIGTSVANRNHREIEGMIGMIVSIIALRADVSGDPSFRDLVKRTHDMAFEAYDHQEIPFEKLVGELKIDRDLSINPLYQVLFGFHDSQVAPLSFPGLNGQIDYLHNGSSKFDLSLVFFPWAEQKVGVEGESDNRGIMMKWEYATDLFTPTTIQRMARHYQNLMQEVIRNPDKPLSELSMLSAEEQQQILHWNPAPSDYPREQTIHGMFEQQVAITPDAIAVEFEDQALSYSELNSQANRLAHYLQSQGVGADVIVAICVPRSLQMIVGLLAILKAGGAYLPLDRTFPAERLNYMLEDSGAKLLLSKANLPAGLVTHDTRVICLERDSATISEQNDNNLVQSATADNLAYVLYTSGSTGKPKGVMGLHRCIVNRLFWGWSVYSYSEGDRYCLKTTLNFVDSIQEIFSPLTSGLCVVVADEETMRDVRALAKLLARAQVTHLFLVPSLLQALLKLDDEALSGLDCVRCWLAGGERLDAELEFALQARFPRAALFNLYGSSEISGDATCNDATDRDGRGGSLIGRPIANMRAYVLDGSMNPVPVGVPGELYVGGDGLARGYLNHPGLTEEKFVPDPFSDEPGARLYRMGDSVRYLDDGILEYLGRLDHQIKLRGVRIELGEIESTLLQLTAVNDAVVVVHEDDTGDKRLDAYVVPTVEWLEQSSATGDGDANGAEVEGSLQHELVAELRQQLRQQLPAYMMPSGFVVMDALPLNPHGKVDRDALPVPGDVRASLGVEYAAPRTDLEQQLAGIWAEILKLERVGIHDSFFDLGGHSLMATRVVSRIRAQLNVEFPLSKMFGYRTIAEQAPLIESLLDGSQDRRAEMLQQIRNISAEEKAQLLAAARKA